MKSLIKNIIFVLIFTAFLVGCEKNDNSNSNTPNQNSVPIDIKIQSNQELKIQFYDITDTEMQNEKSAVILNESDSEYTYNFCIELNQDIFFFEFYGVVCDLTDDLEIKVTDKTLIAKTENIEKDKKIIFVGETGEILPVSAISFMTTDGEKHDYFIMQSGKDGSLYLTKASI